MNGGGAVLFDLDGTLLDTAPDMAWALNQVRHEQGLPALSLAIIRPHVSKGSSGLIRLAFGLEREDPRAEALRQRFIEIYAENLSDRTRLFAGMDEVLVQLEAKRLPWGIVTNKPGWLTHPLLAQLALAARAACVIAGVSLRGGIGRVESVVLGAFFIVLVQNGMNLMQIGSYMQMVLLGSLLVLAVVIDQLRYKMLVGNR